MKYTNAIMKQIVDCQMGPARAIAALEMTCSVLEQTLEAADSYCIANIDDEIDRSTVTGKLRKIRFSADAIKKSIAFCLTLLEQAEKSSDDIRAVQQELLLDLLAVQSENLNELIKELAGVCADMVAMGKISFYSLPGMVEH